MQTDAIAVGSHHGHGRGGDSVPKENKRPDDSKYHTVLNHPEEREGGSLSSSKNALQAKGPEEIAVDSGSEAAVTVGSIGAAAVTVGGSGLRAVSVGGAGQGISADVGSAKGVVEEGAVNAAHPESKTQQNQKHKSAKQCTPSGQNPYGCS